ncbi:MAG: hypothetical protein UT81_C0013G0019 [Parcubacteria group bacterium GW2011_GWA2_40_14]|nr:MAG: hypothetical protein UT81_C0013G0019 [Parcubacteria group bacterium GW2011_GWA2_40_14]
MSKEMKKLIREVRVDFNKKLEAYTRKKWGMFDKKWKISTK